MSVRVGRSVISVRAGRSVISVRAGRSVISVRVGRRRRRKVKIEESFCYYV